MVHTATLLLGRNCATEIYITFDAGGFSGLEDVVKLALDLDPAQASGFAVVDKDFNRVKVKSPSHHALEKLCWR